MVTNGPIYSGMNQLAEIFFIFVSVMFIIVAIIALTTWWYERQKDDPNQL